MPFCVVVPEFGAIENVTVPLLVWFWLKGGLWSVTKLGTLLTFQFAPLTAVTVMFFVDAAAAPEIVKLLGATEMSGTAPAPLWETKKVTPAMVRVPLRPLVSVFCATE